MTQRAVEALSSTAIVSFTFRTLRANVKKANSGKCFLTKAYQQLKCPFPGTLSSVMTPGPERAGLEEITEFTYEVKPRMRQILGSFAFVVLISTAAGAQTLRNVPEAYPTIQSAINAAQSGDTIRVAPGVYKENIDFLGKTIAVVSAAGADVTTIDGGLANSVVRIRTGEGPNTVLDGFTIRNGKGSDYQAGGVQIAGSPTIRRNRILNNITCFGGAGISISSGSPIIQGNLISNNFTQGCSGGDGGAGIQVVTPGSTQILDNTITNNSNNASSEGGGISVGFGGPTLIRGNIITGNKGTYGGGIGLSTNAAVTIVQNLIAGNTASKGGGIYWYIFSSGGPAIVTNNTIADNNAIQQGSAIFAYGYDAASAVTNNFIIGKTGQSAVYCDDTLESTPPIFAFNNVFSDQAVAYSGICTNVTGTSGNISAAPLFVDRAAQNLRLLPASPGIDAGTNAAVGVSVDLDSFPRILPSGGTVDMGAYEFTTSTTSTVSTASFTFADQNVGTVSAPGDIILSNTGTAVLLVSTIVVTGEFSQTNTCQTPTGIPAGQSCTISVRFAPTAGGPRSGQITIMSNSTSNAVSLSGAGVAPVTLSTNAITFIDQRIGTASAAAVLSFSNTGTEGLNISSITTTGEYTSSNDCPSTVDAGSSCTISIQFVPTAMGIRFGAVTVSSAGNLYIVTLSGRGVDAVVSFSPTFVEFYNQAIGTTSAPKTVTVSNTGNIALAINNISYPGNFSGTNNCGGSLGINATCIINVVYSPTVVGLQSGVISVSDDANGSPHTVALSGTTNSATLTANPTSLEFGNQGINSTSVLARNVTLHNTGFQTLNISTVASTDFSRTGNCTFLFPNAFCNLSVTFRPTSMGPKTGTLTVTEASLGTMYTLPLSGTGVDFVFSSPVLGFGDVHIGTISTRTVTLNNNDPNSVNISGISITAGFSQTNSCGPTLASGASCSFDVTFSPVTAGLFASGTLTITDDAVGSPHTLPLSGRGVVGTVSLSSANLVFGADLVGTTSLGQTVTVSNTGTGPLTLSGITASGDFIQTTTCGATLAANSNCTVNVKFLPTASGSRIGSLTITSDGSNSPNTVNLTGTGLSSLPTPVITAISPGNRPVGSSGSTITVSGSGFSTLSIVRWGGADRATTFINSSSLTATIPDSDFAAMAMFPVTVFSPEPGGGLSNSKAFVVYGVTTLSTKDLIYDLFSGQIYASIGGTAPNRANTLTPLDPATGVVGTSINVGADPGKLAISNDSTSIYAALDGEAHVRRLDTVSQLPGIAFGLGADPTYGPYYVEDIAVAPGEPGTIAVSRRIPNRSPRHAGVAIYDNGAMRPVATPGFSGSNLIEYGASSAALYGYNSETSEFGFRTMSVDASGVNITNVQTNFMIGDFRFEGGRIYTVTGQILDPVNRIVLGHFATPQSTPIRGLVVDAALNRAFYLAQLSSSLQIIAFDLTTFAQTGSLTLSDLTFSNSGSLVRWGSNGLAFRIDTQVLTLQIPQDWVSAVLPSVLTVYKNGLGSGFVTSVQTGIACGATCTAPFPSGEIVVLTATPAPGSEFQAWGGDADCTDGRVTMSADISCTATFSPIAPKMLTIDKRGNGSGTITSSPAGINCGTICSGEFTTSTLTVVPFPGSIFSGWSGDPDCIDGSVTMTSARSCVARFDLPQTDSTLLRGDYDGDGKSDMAVYRPATGEWFLRLSTVGYAVGQGNWYFQWGVIGDIPVSGDFDGDGKSEIAVYRPSTGEWLLRLSTQGYAMAAGNWYFQWGVAGDVPITGDFDGDGKSEIAVYRPSTGDWFLRLSTQGYQVAAGNWTYQWGVSGDQPVSGDFDGDRKTDIAVYRPSTGEWFLRLSSVGYAAGQGNWTFQWGVGGDQPVASDFDGDRKTDIAVYRPSTGEWFLRLSSFNFAVGQGNWTFQWGTAGDLTIKGDFDGDAKSEIAVFRPSTGEWFFRLSTFGYGIGQGDWTYQWGGTGDLPLRR